MLNLLFTSFECTFEQTETEHSVCLVCSKVNNELA